MNYEGSAIGKAIIVGNESVGKTCLLRHWSPQAGDFALVRGSCVDERPATKALARQRVLAFCMGKHPRLGAKSNVRLLPRDLIAYIFRFIEAERRPLRAQVWDHQSARFFNEKHFRSMLRRAMVVALCFSYDDHESFEHCFNWFKRSAAAACERVYFVLVGLKADAERRVAADEIQSFRETIPDLYDDFGRSPSGSCHFFEVSSVTGLGCDELLRWIQERIGNTVSHLEEKAALRDSVPVVSRKKCLLQ